MAEYIDKAVVLDRFCKVIATYERVDDCSTEIMKQAQRIVREVHAADVEPVRHGEWEGTADGYADGELVYDMWNCSECGFDADGAEERPN